MFFKALWLVYGDKIGREQVWKWESTGQAQTSRDVGGTVLTVGRREPGDRGRCVLPRPECVTPSPRSVDCPWPSARPGPGVELVVPGEDSCALRHPSVGRHAPPALPSYTREPGFMVI